MLQIGPVSETGPIPFSLGESHESHNWSVVAFAIGFAFRLAAIWFLWEEPMPKRIPAWLLKGQPKRESLKEKMQPGWKPSWEQPEE